MLCIVFYCLLGALVLTNAYRTFDVNGEETILAFEKEKIKIECKSELPMFYCGFVDPYGKRYSFTDLSVHNGQCVHVIKATRNDSGEWRCHMGSKTARLEKIKRIRVRVVNQLAAVQTNVTAKVGKATTLSCATTGGFIALRYCRFESPSGNSFCIDETVTDSNSILNRFYYPKNQSVDRGDCSVTIRKVKSEDLGLWTCAAGMGDSKEYVDSISVNIEGISRMSTASMTAVTIGGILVAVALGFAFYGIWKNRWLMGAHVAEQRQPEVIEMSTPQPTRSRSVPELIVTSPSTATPVESPLLSITSSK